MRLIRVFDYIQRFNLNIRHKSNKQHVVSNVLSRFFNDNIDSKIDETKNELNALFIVSFVEMNEVFRKRIINDYKSNLNWKRIIEVLNVDDENVAKLFFCKKKMISFFDKTISLSTIMFTSYDVFAFRISLFKIYFIKLIMTITSITLNVTSKFRFHITFEIFRDIFEIIWNIA